MSDESLAALDTRITELDALIAEPEAERSRLKRLRRARLAGLASGKARASSWKALALQTRYLEADDRDYGVIRRLAKEIGLSERQAHRILRDLKPCALKGGHVSTRPANTAVEPQSKTPASPSLDRTAIEPFAPLPPVETTPTDVRRRSAGKGHSCDGRAQLEDGQLALQLGGGNPGRRTRTG
jgi:hypothetical protein